MTAPVPVVLLPCPVCGDQPQWRGTRSDYARGIFRLQCLGETHLFQAYGPSEEACVSNWNRRAPSASTEKLVAALAWLVAVNGSGHSSKERHAAYLAARGALSEVSAS